MRSLTPHTTQTRAAGGRVGRLLSILTGALAAAVTVAMPRPAQAVPMKVTYTDAAGYGFKDPAVGAKRKAALEAAAANWSNRLKGSVPITISAHYTNTLPADLNSAVLAVGRPTLMFQNTPGLPLSDTLYPYALANELAGKDVNPSSSLTNPAPEIDVEFNDQVGTGMVLLGEQFYYGTDGNNGSDIDFCSVAMHEIAHGLGFLSTLQGSGTYSSANPDVFSTFLASGPTLSATHLSGMTAAARKAALTSGGLYFVGPKTNAAGGGNGARLYAPNPFEDGNSIYHLDEDTYHGANEMMTPLGVVTGEAETHDPGPIALAMLMDMGWDKVAATTHSLSGQVFFFHSGSAYGLPKITVSLLNALGVKVQTVTTQADGNYIFPNLAAGTYTVQVSPPPLDSNLTFAAPGPTRKVVISKLDVEDVQFWIETASVIGFIMDSSGHGMGGVKVDLQATVAGSPQPIFTVSANTAADGFFYFNDLCAMRGFTYTFSASKTGRQFKPGIISLDGSELVNPAGPVRFAETTTTPLPTFTLSGQVVDFMGVGYPKIQVNYVPGKDVFNLAKRLGSTTTDAQGHFTISGVTPGDYTILPDGDDALGAFGANFRHQTVTVTTTNVTGLQLSLEPTFLEIKGRITQGDGVGIPGVGVTLYNHNGNMATSRESPNFYTVTDKNGEYKLAAAPSEFNYFVEPRVDGMHFSPARLSVAVRQFPITNADFMRSSYDITGQVLNSSGVGARGIDVALTAPGSPAHLQGGPTDANGFYRFRDVPVGKWVVKISDSKLPFAPTSQTVTVAKSNVTGVNFTSTLHNITGKFTDGLGNGLAGIRITCSDAKYPDYAFHSVQAAISGSDGSYTLTDIPDGSYMLVPYNTTLALTPAKILITMSKANLDHKDFTRAYTISGTVLDLLNKAVAGATITCSNIQGTVITTATSAASGSFTLNGVPGGSYTLSAAKTGLPLGPGSLPVTVGNANVAGLTFQAAILKKGSLTFYLVAIRVVDSNGNGIAGVGGTRKDSDSSGNWSSTTNAAGYFYYYNTADSITLTPAKSGLTFSPPSAVVSTRGGNLPYFTFVGKPATRSIAIGNAAPSKRSSTSLSTATAQAVTNCVQLRFTNALDAVTAGDATYYSITINGRAVNVESAGYNGSNHTVTLDLPTGTLHSGDHVLVRWHDLQDTKGRTLAGSTSQLIVR